ARGTGAAGFAGAGGLFPGAAGATAPAAGAGPPGPGERVVNPVAVGTVTRTGLRRPLPPKTKYPTKSSTTNPPMAIAAIWGLISCAVPDALTGASGVSALALRAALRATPLWAAEGAVEVLLVVALVAAGRAAPGLGAEAAPD